AGEVAAGERVRLHRQRLQLLGKIGRCDRLGDHAARQFGGVRGQRGHGHGRDAEAAEQHHGRGHERSAVAAHEAFELGSGQSGR
ncbi:MAG: hypothetical protein ACK559_32655, partial [bacterium]